MTECLSPLLRESSFICTWLLLVCMLMVFRLLLTRVALADPVLLLQLRQVCVGARGGARRKYGFYKVRPTNDSGRLDPHCIVLCYMSSCTFLQFQSMVHVCTLIQSSGSCKPTRNILNRHLWHQHVLRVKRQQHLRKHTTPNSEFTVVGRDAASSSSCRGTRLGARIRYAFPGQR